MRITKEEMVEAYAFEIEEIYTRDLTREQYDFEDFEKILGDMYDEMIPPQDRDYKGER